MKRNYSVRTRIILFAMILSVLFFTSSAFAEVNQWTSNGPFGGDIPSIAVSPAFSSDNTVFAGTMGSGVYKSTDGGETWTQTSLTGKYIYSVAVSPSYAADHIIFAGTMSGVYITTDGGESWTLAGLDSKCVSSVAVSPNYTADRTVFAGTDGSGIYKSTDGGGSWTQVNVGLAHLSVNVVAVTPSFANTVFAGTRNGGMYRSDDGGQNWYQYSSLSGTSVYSIDFSTTAGGYIAFAGTNNGVYRSNNGGAWAHMVMLFHAAYSVAVSPNFTEDNTVFTGTSSNGIYKSTDGGQSWTQTGLGGRIIRSLEIAPGFADGAVFSGCSSGGIYKSVNRGSNWTEVNKGLANTRVSSIALSPEFVCDNTVFLACPGEGVFKSVDKGLNWVRLTGIGSIWVNAVAVSPGFARDDTVFAGTNAGVFKSTDRGSNWIKMDNGLPSYATVTSLAVSPYFENNGIIYTGTQSSGIYISVNGGQSWVQSNNGLTNTQIMSIAVSPNFASDSTVFVGTFSGGVFKSTDGGQTWVPVNSGLNQLGIYSVALSPNYVNDNTVFIATWNGVYRSGDGGASWAQINSGLTKTNTWSVAVSPNFSVDKTVFAGTWGGAVFRYDGERWIQNSSGLTETSMYIKTVAVSPGFATDKTVFMGTDTNGAFRMVLDLKPSTTLSTDPLTTDGNSGWFKTVPYIKLLSDKPGTTYYSWDPENDTWTAYSVPFPAREGVSTLYYYSVYLSEAEEVKTQIIKVDTVSPSGSALTLPTDGSEINRPYPYFSWSSSADSGSGIAKYQLYIDGSLARDNITGASAVPQAALTGGTHTWYVRALDHAGNYTESATGSFTVRAGTEKISFISLEGDNWDIHIMDSDGSNITRLTTEPLVQNQPCISPDGTKIVYTSSVNFNNEIFLMNIDGTGKTRLTNNDADDQCPAFSPDGSKIVFISNRDVEEGFVYEIYTMNTDGSDIKKITATGFLNLSPNFSPDGSKIIFERLSMVPQIFTVNTDGTDEMQITDGTVHESNAAFHPNGDSIVFKSWRDGNAEIYRMDADGTNLQRLTNNTVEDSLPVYSPDGTKIAYISFPNLGIWVMNTDGSGAVKIYSNNAIGNSWVSWGPGAVSAESGNTPPVTTKSVNPSSPDGNNNWYVTAPSVLLTCEGAAAVNYSWDLPEGPWATYNGSFFVPEGSHTLRYFAVDAEGCTEDKRSHDFKVDTVAPSAPSLSAAAISGTQVELYWPVVTDETSGMSGYQIFNAQTDTLIAGTQSASYIHSGLTKGQNYSYYVKAVDNAGNVSAKSSTVAITTPVEISGPITGGSDVTVDLGGGAKMVFDQVTDGEVSIVVKPQDKGAPSGFRLSRGAYYEITTTATFSGYVTVTLPYNPDDIEGQEKNLKLFHWKNHGWEDITVSVDTVNKTITGRTTSFSPFAVGEPLDGGGVEPPSYQSYGMNTYLLWISSAAVMLLGLSMIRRGSLGRCR